MNGISARRKTTIAALVVFCLIPFIRLGEGDMQSDEVLYAYRARAVAESGNLFPETPMRFFFGGQPPLTIWGMAFAIKLFGFSSFSARLVSALSAAGIVLAVYWLALLVMPPVYALGAAGLLASSSLFLRFSQLAQLDISWILFITIGFTLFWYGRELENKKLFYLSAVFFGLSFVAKLFVSVIPLAAFLLWAAMPKDERTIHLKDALRFAAVIAAIALPWHVWAFLHYGNEAYEVMVGWNLVNRVTKGAESTVKATGRLFYMNQMIVGFPFIMAAFVFFIRRAAQAARAKSLRFIPPIERFCWVWLLFPMLVLSVVKAEMQSYAVQLLPPLALLAMLGVEELSRADVGRGWRAATLLGIAAACAWGFSQTLRDGAREFFASGYARVPAPTGPFLIAAAIMVICTLAVLLLSRGNGSAAKNLFLLLPTWGVALFVVVRVAVAAGDVTDTRSTGARQIAETLPARSPVALITGSANEEDERMQFQCYDASTTLYRRLALFNRDTFAFAPIPFPDSIHYIVLEKPDPYFFNDSTGRISETNLFAQHYVLLLRLPKYELFARGLARDLIYRQP